MRGLFYQRNIQSSQAKHNDSQEVLSALIFENIPHAAANEEYDDAVALYAQKIAMRVTALYRVGAMSFPGLSDIDLLVVVPGSRRDNNQFFNVFYRLPNRFHGLFRHQPSVLPETAIDVFQHSTHYRPSLVIGNNVLGDRQVLATREEHWCRVFQGYCNQEAYLARCQKRVRIAAGQAVAQACSLRYVLRDLDAVLYTSHAVLYSNEIDTLRAALLARTAEGPMLIAEIWNKLCEKMLWLQTTLTELLPLHGQESVQDFGVRFLLGRSAFDSLDSSTILSRRQRIDFYHAELKRMKFSYGHMFPVAAYDLGSQRHFQWRFERYFYSVYYKVGTSLAF
jgi:hypothetical protein